jgi:hypothetical protein
MPHPRMHELGTLPGTQCTVDALGAAAAAAAAAAVSRPNPSNVTPAPPTSSQLMTQLLKLTARTSFLQAPHDSASVCHAYSCITWLQIVTLHMKSNAAVAAAFAAASSAYLNPFNATPPPPTAPQLMPQFINPRSAEKPPCFLASCNGPLPTTLNPVLLQTLRNS